MEPKLELSGEFTECQVPLMQIELKVYFKYNCQPRDYISKGEKTVDIQSKQAATLHLITIRVILPQFTMIGCNRHRMGTIINSSLSRD